MEFVMEAWVGLYGYPIILGQFNLLTIDSDDNTFCGVGISRTYFPESHR